MDPTELLLSWDDHHKTLCSVFEELLESNTLVDCTIAAEGQYLKAHKVVLSACSSYFQILFSQENEKNPIVILKDIKYYELRAIIDFVYRGKVNIAHDQLEQFLEVAESLQIKGLGHHKEKKLEENIIKTGQKPPVARKRRKVNSSPNECSAPKVFSDDNRVASCLSSSCLVPETSGSSPKIFKITSQTSNEVLPFSQAENSSFCTSNKFQASNSPTLRTPDSIRLAMNDCQDNSRTCIRPSAIEDFQETDTVVKEGMKTQPDTIDVFEQKNEEYIVKKTLCHEGNMCASTKDLGHRTNKYSVSCASNICQASKSSTPQTSDSIPHPMSYYQNNFGKCKTCSTVEELPETDIVVKIEPEVELETELDVPDFFEQKTEEYFDSLKTLEHDGNMCASTGDIRQRSNEYSGYQSSTHLPPGSVSQPVPVNMFQLHSLLDSDAIAAVNRSSVSQHLQSGQLPFSPYQNPKDRHFPDIIPPTKKKSNPTRQCAMCHLKRDAQNKKIRRESRYYCPGCNVALCVTPCFRDYHTTRDI